MEPNSIITNNTQNKDKDKDIDQQQIAYPQNNKSPDQSQVSHN